MADLMRAVVGAITHARLSLIALAVVLHLTGLAITGERWRVVIAALGNPLPLRRAILINLAGIFVRNATPTTGLGGDASRIALLRAEGVPLAQATASFAYVRLAEAPPIALVVALSAPAVAAIAERSSTTLAVAAACLGVAAAAVWLASNRLRTQLASLRGRISHLRIDRGSASLAVFYATLAQVETIARQIVVAAAFGVPITVQQSAMITAMTIVGGFVPTVGSVGAIDGAMVAGLLMCGAPADAAVAITVLERAISYGVSTALGAASLAVLGGRAILRGVSERNRDAVSAR